MMKSSWSVTAKQLGDNKSTAEAWGLQRKKDRAAAENRALS